MEKPGLTGGILSPLGFSVCDFGTDGDGDSIFKSADLGF